MSILLKAKFADKIVKIGSSAAFFEDEGAHSFLAGSGHVSGIFNRIFGLKYARTIIYSYIEDSFPEKFKNFDLAFVSRHLGVL